MVDDVAGVLARLIREHTRPGQWEWLEQTANDLAASRVALADIFPAVSRHVGRGGLNAPGTRIVATSGEQIEIAAWRVDDAARVYLLLADATRTSPASLGRAVALYWQGDARERTGVLRALSFLPMSNDDASALPVVLDAMRASQGELFEAAICDSPYASRHLSQHDWRKAVLKVVFAGLEIRRVVHVSARADADLARSFVAFAEEREAAHRDVPADLWPVAAMFPPPGLAAKLLGYLEHPDATQRCAAATALGRLVPGDPRLRPFLADRAGREPSELVVAALRLGLVE
jgi:hypothetical protein